MAAVRDVYFNVSMKVLTIEIIVKMKSYLLEVSVRF